MPTILAVLSSRTICALLFRNLTILSSHARVVELAPRCVLLCTEAGMGAVRVKKTGIITDGIVQNPLAFVL